MYYRNMCHHLLLQIEDDENEAGKQTKGRQLRMVSSRFSRDRNCAMLTIVTLKDGLLLFTFPLSTGTRTIANWLN